MPLRMPWSARRAPTRTFTRMKSAPRGGGHGHGADPVVTEEIDAERSREKLSAFGSEGSEAGDGGRPGRVGGEGRVTEIFHDDGVSAALFQGQQVTAHGLPDGIEFAAVVRCAGKRG